MESKTIQLADRRILGYIEYGNPEGKPLFYFHGHPGSRFEAGFLVEAAKKNGIRLIGIDRPGLGLSSYKPGRHILDWTNDVVELADNLHIDRFAVVGFSGGGPYALACALKIPEKLTACGVVSGVGRTGFFLSFLSMWLPWLMLPLITKRLFSDKERAKKSLMKFTKRWIASDRKALSSPDVMDTLVASIVESLRRGTTGAAYDGTLIGNRNWGFQLENINFSSIYLWHGELDKDIDVLKAREMAKKLEHCKATFYPNDGHISTIINHREEIVATLMKDS